MSEQPIRKTPVSYREWQRRHILRAMSDDEFERRYDPEAYFRNQLLKALQDLTGAIDQMTRLPERTGHPYTPPQPKTPPTGRGVMEL